jgi:DNA-binding transcriptional ArsR family regulator
MSPRRPSAAARAVELVEAAPLFAALGDETRLRLVARLCADGPASIARLTSGAGVTRQAVAKHLNVLADVGVARGTRRGRERLWQIEPTRIDEARRCLDHISAQWDEALGRLRASLEEEPAKT